MKKTRILVVDDEKGIRSTLKSILEDEGWSVATAGSGEEALARLDVSSFDVVILDVWLPQMDGLELLGRLRDRRHEAPVIVISGHGSVETAVKATKLGAYDFLEKPLALERVLLTVRHAIEHHELRCEVENFKRREEGGEGEELLGETPVMVKLRQEIATAACSHSRVLISGENGTGKEVAARLLHRLSLRAEEPFVEVNCAAIPEELIESELFGHVKGAFTGAHEEKRGKFEQANGATLFLDEIGDMSMKTQSKVLRALQEQRLQRVGGEKTIDVDVRVVAATNKHLEEEIGRGNFREDLYFRLNVIPLTVPPLRERKADIPLLARHFIDRVAREYGKRAKTLSRAAEDRLRAYPWPGNVRELKNFIERAMIMAPAAAIEADDLPALRPGAAAEAGPLAGDFASLREARDDFERAFIVRRLEENSGNVSRTADALKLERSNLYRKLRAYGIEVRRQGT